MSEELSLCLGLKYYSGIYDEDELQSHLENLRDYKIKISKYDQNGIAMSSVEPSIVAIIVNHAFVQGYLAGLLSNATWAAFEKFIIWATKFKKDKEKQLYKCTPGKFEAIEPTLGLSIDVGNNRKIDFQISGELTDAQKEMCIKNAFEYIKSIPPLESPSIEIAIYDIENNTWKIIDLIEEKIKGQMNE